MNLEKDIEAISRWLDSSSDSYINELAIKRKVKRVIEHFINRK
jgi:hypothetical protein